MKEPKVEMLALWPAAPTNGTFYYEQRSLISHCSGRTACRVFYQWLGERLLGPGRALVAIVTFQGGETPAERIAVMDNVVALCEATREVS